MSIETNNFTSQAPTIDSLLARADMFIKNKDYNNASLYYNKVLDINPYTSRAHWGLLLCKIGSVNFETLTDKPQPITSYVEYATALEYAENDETAQKYTATAQKMQARFDSLWVKRAGQLKEELSAKIQKSKKMLKTFNILRLISIIIPFLPVLLFICIVILVLIINGGFLVASSTQGTTGASALPLLILLELIVFSIFVPLIVGFSVAVSITKKSIASKEEKIKFYESQGV